MEFRMHPVQAMFIVSVLFIALAVIAHFIETVVNHPERVRVRTLDGKLQDAEIVGASELRPGEWQRTKVRLFGADGDALWSQGDGFSVMGVMKKDGIFLVRAAT